LREIASQGRAGTVCQCCLRPEGAPKEVIARLNTRDGAPLYLSETPDGYRLVPFDPVFEKKMEAAESIISRYPNTLHILAK